MSPEIIGLLGIVALLVLMGAGMWIGLCMALVGIVGIAVLRGFDQSILISGIMPFEQISFYPLSVLPMFVLMGVLVSECGIGSDLYNTAYKWVGNIRGGLAMATVFACTALGAVTGISSAAIVTMGKAAYPEMKKYRYDEALSTGSIACAGTLDFLIPPSLPFVLYAIFTENSVGKLYMAGILPGLLLAGLFCITIYIITTIRPSAGPPGPRVGFKEKIKSIGSSWHIFLLFFLCLGGIYAGIFTPTEAGAVGAAGAIIIALIVRRLTFKILFNSFKETAMTTGMIFFIIASVWMFIHFLAVSKLPFAMSTFVGGLDVPPLVILIIVIIIYIILGTALDVISCIILTIPVIYPVMMSVGYDPIWFGVILMILIEMGVVSPPEGMDVFILSGITKVPVGTIFRGVMPFIGAMIVCIIILIMFPEIALFLPSTMK